MSRQGTITGIQRQKKNQKRFNIFLNEEYAFSVHEDILVKHRLMKGYVVDQEEFASILKEEEFQKAYHQALKIMGRRNHSELELTNKLRTKGFEDSLVQQVIQKMIEQKYINDEEFAKQWVIHRIRMNKKGKNWIKQELLQKGITKTKIETALNQIESNLEYEHAAVLAKKKWKQIQSKLHAKQKLASYLMRQGYEYSLIHRIVEEITDQKME